LYTPITVAARCKEHICSNSATNSKFAKNSFNSKAEETGTNSSFYAKSVKAFFISIQLLQYYYVGKAIYKKISDAFIYMLNRNINMSQCRTFIHI